MNRTTAMNAFVAAYVAEFVVLVVFLLNVLGVLPVFELPEGGDPSAFALPLALFGVLMLAVIAAALWWSRAPGTRWFWLLGAIPGVLFFLPDIPIVIKALTSPGALVEPLFAAVVTASVLVLVASAVISFREARSARPD